MTFPENMAEISRECGYQWPDDDEGRLRVLVGIANVVLLWRRKFDDALSGVTKDRIWQHHQRRYWSLAKKLRAVRKAAVEYKAGRDFDRFAELREENERLRRRIAELETQAIR